MAIAKSKTTKPAATKKPSAHEEALRLDLRAAGISSYVREHKFHPVRKWRFDFAFPERKIGIECEGGIWARAGGRHNRGSGYEADAEKYNEAALHGWRVFRFTERMIKSGMAIQTIVSALESFKPEYQEKTQQQGLGI